MLGGRERKEKERKEKEGMEKEGMEKERMEKERMEKERMEKERMEKERKSVYSNFNGFNNIYDYDDHNNKEDNYNKKEDDNSNKIIEEFEDNKITKYLRMKDNKGKLRLSYSPNRNKDTLTLIVNYDLLETVGYIKEIIKSEKYKKIKIYTKEDLNEEKTDLIFEELKFENYHICFSSSFHSSLVSDSVSKSDLLCVFLHN